MHFIHEIDMSIKSVIQKIVAGFKAEETVVVSAVKVDITKVEADVSKVVTTVTSLIPTKESIMADAVAGTVTTVDKVALAIQIALHLKSLDATLTDAAIQAGTAAALAAAYPAV